MAQKYEAQVQGHPLPWGTTPSHTTIAAAVWAYLCPATMQMYKPHYVFSYASAPGGPGD